MSTARSPLFFNAFLMNTGSHIQHGQWRHPEARQSEFNDLQLWLDVAWTTCTRDSRSRPTTRPCCSVPWPR